MVKTRRSTISPAWSSVAGARIALLALAALASAAAPAPGQSPSGGNAERTAGGDRRPQATIALTGGQAIVGRVLDDVLTIRTRYGTLRVPFADIVRVRFSPYLPPEDRARIPELAKIISEEGPESEAGSAALRRIREMGLGALPQLRKAVLEGGTATLAAVVAELEKAAALEAEEAGLKPYLEDDDEIVSKRFTMRGKIVEETIRVECISGILALPRRDILEIAYGDLEIVHTWKVGPQHSERGRILDTGLKLRKGQKFTLTATGMMTYNGQPFGPGGLPNHTWNGRRMGCLQWRVGGGPWQILESNFEGRAPQAGTLQFSVHLLGGDATGEFKVTFRSRKR